MHGAGLELALVFLLAAVLAVPVFKRFGLGAVLGLPGRRRAAGTACGGVIADAEPVLAASEIGVVMLLFVIGLELSLPRLKVMRRPIFGIGGLRNCSKPMPAKARWGGSSIATADLRGAANPSQRTCLFLLSALFAQLVPAFASCASPAGRASLCFLRYSRRAC